MVFLWGCTVRQPQANVEVTTLPNGISIASYPADLRGAYIIPETVKNTKMCAEPVPDVALGSIEKISAELSSAFSGVTIGADGGYDLANNVVELAGRTQLLMLAREMLYRACEVSLNTPENPEVALELYQSAQQFLASIADSEQTKANASFQRALKGQSCQP
jgi:hypothetical protein